ncbi:MAG: YIP1 family protein, partial [Halothermotrichaceae bacterium]
KEKEDWLFPIIILLVVAVIVTLIQTPINIEKQIEYYTNNPDISVEQKNTMIEQTKGIFPYIGGSITIIIIVLFSLTFMAGVFYGIRFLFGGEKVGFKHLFSAVCYTGLINVLAYIFALIVIFTSDKTQGLTLSAFLPNIKGFLQYLFGSISLFGIWQTVLYGLILNVFYKYNKSKSFTISFSVFLILSLLKAGYAYLAAGMVG